MPFLFPLSVCVFPQSFSLPWARPLLEQLKDNGEKNFCLDLCGQTRGPFLIPGFWHLPPRLVDGGLHVS